MTADPLKNLHDEEVNDPLELLSNESWIGWQYQWRLVLMRSGDLPGVLMLIVGKEE